MVSLPQGTENLRTASLKANTPFKKKATLTQTFCGSYINLFSSLQPKQCQTLSALSPSPILYRLSYPLHPSHPHFICPSLFITRTLQLHLLVTHFLSPSPKPFSNVSFSLPFQQPFPFSNHFCSRSLTLLSMGLPSPSALTRSRERVSWP